MKVGSRPYYEHYYKAQQDSGLLLLDWGAVRSRLCPKAQVVKRSLGKTPSLAGFYDKAQRIGSMQNRVSPSDQRHEVVPHLDAVPLASDHFQQVANATVLFDGMPKGLVFQDFVLVLTPHLGDFQKATFLKIDNDSLDRTLGDANTKCHLTKDQGGFRLKHRKHMSMVGEKRPAAGRSLRLGHAAA